MLRVTGNLTTGKYLNPVLPESNCSTYATLSATKAVVQNGWMGTVDIL